MEARRVLQELASLDDETQLQALESVVRDLRSPGTTAPLVPELFALLERFPFDDSYGLFSSVMHALETVPGIEAGVVDSVRRSPSQTTLCMINRLLNGGITRAGEVDLLNLLKDVAASAEREEARRLAAEFLAFQASQAG